MREIKFRAWYKPWNEMSDTFTLFDIYSGRDEVTIPRKGEWGDDIPFDKNELDLMQYTGLKDKNGKEIFESDIVITRGSYIGEIPCEVTYNEDFCRYDLTEKGNGFKNNYSFPVGSGIEYEVIGNIYENPELLKEKTK